MTQSPANWPGQPPPSPKGPRPLSDRLRITLLLAPAMVLIVVLFFGGLAVLLGWLGMSGQL